MKIQFVLVLVLLSGCGGAQFSGAFDSATDGGDAAALGTGGEPNAMDDAGASGGSSADDAGKYGSGGTTGGMTASGGTTSAGDATTVPGSGGTTESGGTTSSGGAVACTLVTHSDGVGQTWQDCVPLYTYNEAQAMKACEASGAALCLQSTRCGPTVLEVQGFNSDRSHLVAEWGYGDFATGYVSPDYNLCGSGDPAREMWD